MRFSDSVNSRPPKVYVVKKQGTRLRGLLRQSRGGFCAPRNFRYHHRNVSNSPFFDILLLTLCFVAAIMDKRIDMGHPQLCMFRIVRRSGGVVMFNFLSTRKDGYAFGLERSGFKVATKVKNRQTVTTPNCCITSKGDRAPRDNPLLFKKVRHG